MMHICDWFLFSFKKKLPLFEIKVVHKMFYVKTRLIVVDVFTSKSYFHVKGSCSCSHFEFVRK